MSSVGSSIQLASPCAVHARTRVPIAPPDQLISRPRTIGAVILCDVLSTLAAGTASLLLPASHTHPNFGMTIVELIGVAGVFFALLAIRWAYTIRALGTSTRSILNAAVALFLALSADVISLALFGAYSNDKRAELLAWYFAALSCCAITRVVVASFIERWTREGRLARRAVVVGGDVAELLQQLDRTPSGSIQILGLFDDRDNGRSTTSVADHPRLGRFDNLVEFCRSQRVDLLIVALPFSAEDRLLHLLKKLWVLPIDVRIAALGCRLKLRARAYSYIGDVPFLPVFDKPMSDWSVAAKNIQDRLIAGVLLVLLSPLLGLIALAVKLDSRGPALFKQIRHGFNNEPIEVYKFRSMYLDQTDALGLKLTTRDDPRVTRVGRFIRRTSLDELPQLFNVAIKGNLALVGPRPHAPQCKAADRLYEEVVDGYFARHRVKPGITGWAQVKGWRGETDTVEKLEQRVAHDLYYIENWSMVFDLRILAMTPFALIGAKNAY
ncbi:MAG: undecaprenyl-phosphate glucose phosphotransferase [Methylocystis sp.]